MAYVAVPLMKEYEDMQSLPSNHYPAMCPICALPLTAPSGYKGKPYCSSCGFSGPFVPRKQQSSPGSKQLSAPENWTASSVHALRQLSELSPALDPEKFLQGSQLNLPTPIPPRSSAHRFSAERKRATYPLSLQGSNRDALAELPTTPPPVSALSDQVDAHCESVADLPTRPDLSPTQEKPVYVGNIGELKTVSPVRHTSASIDEIATRPLHTGQKKSSVPSISSSQLLPEPSFLDQMLPASSQQHSPVLLPPTDHISPSIIMHVPQSKQGEKEKKKLRDTQGELEGHRKLLAVDMNSLDRMRWWLLHPGRIEFIFGSAATLFLVVMTCVVVLVTALTELPPTSASLGIHQSSNTPVHARDGAFAVREPVLTLLDKEPLTLSTSIHVRGAGFGAHTSLSFTCDADLAVTVADGQHGTLQADSLGTFTVALTLPALRPGQHLLTARDLQAHLLATLSFSLAPGSTPTATPSIPTPTPSSSGPGNFSPAQSQTPVVITPTPQPIPTHVSATPTPVPTLTPTITPQPTGTPSLNIQETPVPTITPTTGP